MDVSGDYHSTVSELAASIGIVSDNDAIVRGIHTDVSVVMQGDIWASLRPTEAQCALAKEQGVVAILCRDVPAVEGVDFLQTNHLEQSLGVLLNVLYAEPSSHMNIMAVTGTNGKTTVAYLCASAMSYLQRSATMIGTLGYGPLGQIRPQRHTTPPVGELHQKLALARDRGADFIAMEASSHGLDQGRLAGVMIDVAVFTNLTHEHLDYHKTINDYLAAKQKLFMMQSVGVAVINYDDPSGEILAARINKPLWACGLNAVPRGPQRWSYCTVHDQTLNGMRLKITTHEASVSIDTPLIGRFNAENLMLSHAALCVSGIDPLLAASALGSVSSIPGRMQRIQFSELLCEVIIDYSHTPAALEGVLQTLDEVKQGRLWLVFGCGGDRDRKKRPMMGSIAERYADEVIITEDNSRSEQFEDIAQEILSGAKCPAYCHTIKSRQKAIGYAIRQAQAGDIVLIAGKGHETYQDNGETLKSYSDILAVESILEAN
ncbi:UDP-N-acetylmuramoyl-L-alanyl-D-glutamate--2,6-diaminopimelate ligase [Candidatus Synchoanobacter obligatus]|uniref:UDP-N-acetylmuramyl-tripeptide synthetase n=1 Tax=Candidatus Synchoanobacter obligatus TaxID=2919597 RepID=A0ABT1L5U2_9GAMM|nr:UDP-N-acetylmuramoyl-L-alanyl-D-glutamate--2,6-diaminopimelate ligase [Candidatus Synchoanobacter obligatus]MCP8352539.1 UDP-N-acetylmuramoyl-L-alanyl-D-glutamate--2,6-diaminopimelate ligase [Candidatus Synchoanobacter obligatus]